MQEIYKFILNSFIKEKKTTELLEIEDEIELGYRAMAEDEEREREAEDWINGTLHPIVE